MQPMPPDNGKMSPQIYNSSILIGSGFLPGSVVEGYFVTTKRGFKGTVSRDGG
jgi:hypothetical protein